LLSLFPECQQRLEEKRMYEPGLCERIGLALACSFTIGSAVGALHDRGQGMIYDDVLDITWLADVAHRQRVHPIYHFGDIQWDEALNRAADLVYSGYTDWRLPSAFNRDGSGPCVGFNCVATELGHMYYNNMGATAGTSVLAGSNSANLALFENLEDAHIIWTSTAGVSPTCSAECAYAFIMTRGDQVLTTRFDPGHAWYVRDGDVAPIPEPKSYVLILFALGLTGYAIHRQKGPSSAR
jgi:hypothetical protein